MAHSHHMHREHQVSHRRVSKILEEHGSEAKMHSKSPAFSKVTSKSAAEAHDKLACGGAAPKRFARGGKVKHGKGHQTNIAIVVPHHPATPPGAGPTGGPPPGGPPPLGGAPGGPPGMPPGMAPPPGGPPGMPPGMPMRARGGGVKKAGGGSIDGESTKGDIAKWGARAAKNSYFRGGAATGVGREEKAARMKGK